MWKICLKDYNKQWQHHVDVVLQVPTHIIHVAHVGILLFIDCLSQTNPPPGDTMALWNSVSTARCSDLLCWTVGFPFTIRLSVSYVYCPALTAQTVCTQNSLTTKSSHNSPAHLHWAWTSSWKTKPPSHFRQTPLHYRCFPELFSGSRMPCPWWLVHQTYRPDASFPL